MPIAEQSVRKPSRVYLRRGHPLSRGLVAAWPFFAGAGGSLYDVSGRAHHGTLQLNAEWANGTYGPAIDFKNTNDDNYVATTQLGDFGSKLAGPHSAVALCKPTDTEINSTNMSFTWVDNGGGSTRWSFDLDEFNVGVQFRDNDSNVLEVDADQKVSSGEWSTVGYSKGYGNAAADVTFYVNGVEVPKRNPASDGNPDNYSSFNNTVPIGLRIAGNGSVSGEKFSGIISDYRIYERELKPAEMMGYHANPFEAYITKPR